MSLFLIATIMMRRKENPKKMFVKKIATIIILKKENVIQVRSSPKNTVLAGKKSTQKPHSSWLLF